MRMSTNNIKQIKIQRMNDSIIKIVVLMKDGTKRYYNDYKDLPVCAHYFMQNAILDNQDVFIFNESTTYVWSWYI